MQTKELKSVYFVGAGGIGMSALVRYFLTKGYNVGGYDKTPSELTEKLIEEGAKIHYEENVDAIDACFKQKESTLVVYTPAIPAEHKEMVYFRENGFDVQKRAQVLGFLTQSHKGLCVAGTHGKTTTSTMAAHLLHQSSVDCNAFLGGISKNYGTNYILSDSDYVVIEADEFDRSFHWLRPYMTVITATDPDHLDIYGTKEAYLESFRKYTTLIQPGGALIIHQGLEMKADVQEGVKVYEYARETGDFHAENIRIGGGEIMFDFVHPNGVVKDIQLGVPVSINIENGIAAMALAILNGVNDDELREGMKVGVKVTLRQDRMWEFLDRLLNVALPRVRDFRGISADAFDGRGNYSLGLKEQIIFPEIEYDKIEKLRGMNIAITTTAQTDEEARELLRLMGAPFVS